MVYITDGSSMILLVSVKWLYHCAVEKAHTSVAVQSKSRCTSDGNCQFSHDYKNITLTVAQQQIPNASFGQLVL